MIVDGIDLTDWPHRKAWARKDAAGKVTRWFCPLDKEEWPCVSQRVLDALRAAQEAPAPEGLTPAIHAFFEAEYGDCEHYDKGSGAYAACEDPDSLVPVRALPLLLAQVESPVPEPPDSPSPRTDQPDPSLPNDRVANLLHLAVIGAMDEPEAVERIKEAAQEAPAPEGLRVTLEAPAQQSGERDVFLSHPGDCPETLPYDHPSGAYGCIDAIDR